MARLPQPGGDDGNWGEILNDYLSQSLTTSGAIKPGAVTKSDIGLGNVDNTSDSSKPLSIAALSALSVKANVGAASASKLSLLTNIGKARSSTFTVMLYGMSIAATQASPTRVLGAMLQDQYGKALSRSIQGFIAGGSYSNTVQGWRKQPSSCPGYGRARGGAGATALSYGFYGDTVIVECSREADAEAADILIDGVVVGRTPGPGSQAFAQRQTFTVSRGVHTATINPAVGSGYVYFERMRTLDSVVHGVQVIDNTLGGSTLGNMLQVGGTSSGQVDGIQTQGDAGILAHFDRDDVDAFVIQQDVNDAGSAPQATYIDDVFMPAFTKMIEITKARRTPVLLISSMAGHYAMEQDGGGTINHINYERIRTLYREAAAAHNHIEHLDWHEATKMDDIAAYAARYYPAVTNLNVSNGSFTGDFIHPNTLGHSEAQQLVAAALAMPIPTRLGSTAMQEDLMRKLSPYRPNIPQRSLVGARSLLPSSVDGGTDTITTTTAHGLVVGDRVIFDQGFSGVTGLTSGKIYWVVTTASATTFQISDSSGGTVLDFSGTNTTQQRTIWVLENRKYGMPAGVATMLCDNSNTTIEVPYYRDTTLAHNKLSVLSAAIEASTLSDEYGKYIEYTSLQNPGLGGTFNDPNTEGVLTIRARGDIQVRSGTATAAAPTGETIGTNASILKNVTEPIVIAMRIKATASNQYVSYRGRIYEATLTYGTVPILV